MTRMAAGFSRTVAALAARGFTRPRTLLAAVVLGIAVAAAALSVGATSRPPRREVALIARGMAFYLPGDPTPNPRLAGTRGEHLVIVLRNDDVGMAHDLAVEALEAATPELSGDGATARLRLRLPDAPGELPYVCTLHSRLMRGILEVR